LVYDTPFWSSRCRLKGQSTTGLMKILRKSVDRLQALINHAPKNLKGVLWSSLLSKCWQNQQHNLKVSKKRVKKNHKSQRDHQQILSLNLLQKKPFDIKSNSNSTNLSPRSTQKIFLIIFPSFSSLHALSLIILVNSLENYIRLVFLIPFTTEKKFQFTTNTLLCFLLSFPMIYSKKKSISSFAPSTTIEKKSLLSNYSTHSAVSKSASTIIFFPLFHPLS